MQHNGGMPDAQPPAVPSRVASLEALRMAAAVVVVLGHLKMHGLIGSSGSEMPWFLRWTQVGAMSVLLFFALSGYVLTRGAVEAARSGLWMKRRLRRLLPLYYVGLLVPIVGDIAIQHGLRSFGEAARSAVFLSVFLPHAGADARNAPLWSLQVEVWLSLMLWLWAKHAVGKWRQASGVASLTGVSLVLMLLLDPLHIQLVGGIPAFLAGVTLALRDEPWRPATARASAAVVGVVLLLGAPWYVQHQSERVGSLAAFLFVVFAVQAVASLDVPPRWSGLARALGVRTYALYAVHWPVILAIATVLPTAGLARTVVAVLCILLTTELAYRWVDAPAVRWARRGGGSVMSQRAAATYARQRKGL